MTLQHLLVIAQRIETSLVEGDGHLEVALDGFDGPLLLQVEDLQGVVVGRLEVEVGVRAGLCV